MLDNHARASRLRAEPRADLSLGQRMLRFAEAMQERITREVERLDGRARFREERWERAGEGTGCRRVIEGGAVFAHGVVSAGSVRGVLEDGTAFGAPGGRPSVATGLALVLHPVNAHVPAVRAHFRHLALGPDPARPDDEWFGGGAALWPAESSEEDAEGFLRVWSAVCSRHPGMVDCAACRAAAERSILPHRGVGIQYDSLRDPGLHPGQTPEAAFLFTRDAARAFLSSYVPIIERRRRTSDEGTKRRSRAPHPSEHAEFDPAYRWFGIEVDSGFAGGGS